MGKVIKPDVWGKRPPKEDEVNFDKLLSALDRQLSSVEVSDETVTEKHDLIEIRVWSSEEGWDELFDEAMRQGTLLSDQVLAYLFMLAPNLTVDHVQLISGRLVLFDWRSFTSPRFSLCKANADTGLGKITYVFERDYAGVTYFEMELLPPPTNDE